MKKTTRTLSLATCILLAFTACKKTVPSPDALPVAATPEAAMNQFKTAIEGAKPQNLYDMLPESYQGQANDLLKGFATNMDTGIWDTGVGIAKSASTLLSEKKDFLLNGAAGQMGGDTVSKNFDQAAEIITSVVNSDLASLDKLKDAKIGEILAGPGHKIMKLVIDSGEAPVEEMLGGLEGVSFETVEEDGKTILKALKDGEVEGNPFEMVQVEGKWIPTDFKNQFEDMIQEAQAGVEKLGELDAKASQGANMMMGMVKTMIDGLNDATTQEEFDKAMGGILGMMGSLLPNQN